VDHGGESTSNNPPIPLENAMQSNLLQPIRQFCNIYVVAIDNNAEFQRESLMLLNERLGANIQMLESKNNELEKRLHHLMLDIDNKNQAAVIDKARLIS